MINSRLSFRALATGLAFSGLLALTACGGDDDSKSSDTTEATAETTAETTATGDTTATDETTATGDAGKLTPEECASLGEDFASAYGSVASPDFDGEKVTAVFERLDAAVPEELKGDVATMKEALGTFAEVFDKAKDNPTDPDVIKALASVGTAEVTKASTNLTTFFTSSCAQG